MTWLGPVLDDDQRDVVAVLTALTTGRDVVLTDDPAQVAELRGGLAELGLWTLGTAEALGGGGAPWPVTAVVLEGLGRSWPALGLAAAHAHAAVEALAPSGADPDLVAALHEGRAAVAVVEPDGTAVHLSRDAQTVTGSVDRVDAAAEEVHLLVLTGGDSALLLRPAALTRGAVLRRTGLAGALTAPLRVLGRLGETAQELTGVPVPAVRARLRLAAAAVAVGIAGAAADASREYARARRQFGGPLTDLASVRAALLAQASRTSVVLGALLAADPGSSLGATALLREACDAAVDVAAGALQSHGGYGYLAEYPVERLLRDAVSLRAAVDAMGTAAPQGRALVGAVPA
ncbi:acyl-CoA dehydrogenase family protein [Blastococcus sp. SYSU D00820]